MFHLNRTFGACILTAVFLHVVSAHSATYYVATTGSNTNPGTEDQPWQTVAYAVDKMVAGDTTYVKGGTYSEGLIRFKKSGTADAPIKLLNYPDQFPIIDCIVNKSQVNRVILEHSSGFKNPIGWITIEGFEIRNCHDGIKFHNAHDVTIRRNWIHHSTPGQGILGSGGLRVLIDRNIINHNGDFAGCLGSNKSTCTKDHGIYANGTAFTITNNLIYDNLGYGIQAAGTATYSPGSWYASPEFAGSRDWVIANNTIAYQVNRSAIVVWGSSLTNLRIENNIFYENGATVASNSVQGIDFVSAKSTGITIRNNLAYASGSGATSFLGRGATEGVHYAQSGNIVNTDDPRFVNAPATVPASPNFALTEQSPAIDAGLTIPAARIAFNGITRPQGRSYDIGAFEYNSSGDTQSPASPRLQIK